jgi:tetratricopeptide (TPR) repeat protein
VAGAIARAYSAFCYYYRNVGDIEAYVQTAQKQVDALEQTEDYESQFMAYYHIEMTHWYKGMYAEAERYALLGIDLAKRINAPGWESIILAGYTLNLARTGRWAEARSFADRVIPLFKQVGSSSCFPYIFAGLAEIEARSGNADLVRRYVSDSTDLWEQLDNPAAVTRWQIYGNYYLEEWGRAWELAQTFRMDDGYSMGASHPAIYLYSMMLPEVAARLDEALRIGEEALNIARTYQLPPMEGSSHFALGLAYAGKDQVGKAKESFEAALALFDQLNQPLDAGKTHLELGLLARTTGDKPQETKHFKMAGERFDRLGAVYDLEKLNALA